MSWRRNSFEGKNVFEGCQFPVKSCCFISLLVRCQFVGDMDDPVEELSVSEYLLLA